MRVKSISLIVLAAITVLSTAVNAPEPATKISPKLAWSGTLATGLEAAAQADGAERPRQELREIGAPRADREAEGAARQRAGAAEGRDDAAGGQGRAPQRRRAAGGV